MSVTLSRPHYWLVTALDWPDQIAGPYAECSFAIAPSLIPKGILSPPAYSIFDLAKTVAGAGDQQVVMFAELTRTLRMRNTDWPKVGVPNWEAIIEEVSQAPIPALYLTLSKYAHLLLGTVGMDDIYVSGPDGRQERVPDSDFDGLRSSLCAMLVTDWPAYIGQLERAGKIRPAT